MARKKNPLVVSPGGRRYGNIRDVIDPRDHTAFKLSRPPASLPSKVDLEPNTGPVKDQGNLGCCSGFAGTGGREFLYRAYHEYEADKTTPIHDFVLSPMFLYYKERELEGTITQDAGAQIRSVVYCLNHFGLCLETEDRYAPVKFSVPPTSDQLAEGLKYKSGAYHRIIGGVMEMKACLASPPFGYPIVQGIAVFDSFESDEVAKTGLMPIPDVNKEHMLGGHATLVIGYDDSVRCPNTESIGAFKVRNSWGRDWGQNGNFWMPYEFAANSQLLWDAWMTHLGPAWK